MPAKSEQQRKAAAVALSAKRGKTDPSSLKGASKSMYDSMSEKDLEHYASSVNEEQRLREAIKNIMESKVLVTEARAPSSSLYGIIGKYLWPDFLKTVKSKSGKLTWKDNRAISMSIWMAQFDGYTKSDVTFDGTVTMYIGMDNMFITVNWNDAGKGGNEREWEVKHYEDYTTVATEIGKHLKQWQGI